LLRSPADRITQTASILALGGVLYLVVLAHQHRPERFHAVNFGPHVQLVSASGSQIEATRGEEISFDVSWKLMAPLPADSLIAYYVGNPASPYLAYVDTRGPMTGGAAYTEVGSGGRLIRDRVKIRLPRDVKPGFYEVSTFVYPPANYELGPPLSSAVNAGHRTLFTLFVP
jgi:hypothetical protein